MSKKAIATITSSMAFLTIILAAGWYGWTEVVISFFSHSGFLPLPVLMGFGFLAGALSFFAPCAFVLFPGYISYYLSQGNEENEGENRKLQSFSVGSACGLGAVAFFTLLGLGISLVGSSISHYLITIKPLIALFIFLLGILLLANVSLDLSRIRNRIPIRLPRGQNPGSISLGSFLLYGFGYGMATTGCTFPIFLSLIIVPITSGRFLAGLLTFLSFAAAVGLFMMTATVLIGFSSETLLKRLATSTSWIKRAGGLVLILAGLYLGYFFIRAGM